jgi:hypothetical protein
LADAVVVVEIVAVVEAEEGAVAAEEAATVAEEETTIAEEEATAIVVVIVQGLLLYNI